MSGRMEQSLLSGVNFGPLSKAPKLKLQLRSRLQLLCANEDKCMKWKQDIFMNGVTS